MTLTCIVGGDCANLILVSVAGLLSTDGPSSVTSIPGVVQIAVGMHQAVVPEEDAMGLGNLQSPRHRQLQYLLEIPI